jgi:hypothetical protein
MNEEQRRKKAEYQKLYRARNKIEIVKPVIEEIALDVEPLKRKPKRAKKVALKESTINTYVSKLRAFHRRMTGLDLSENIISAISGEEYDKEEIKTEFKYLYDRLDYIKETEIKSVDTLCKIFTKFVGFVKLVKILTPFKKQLELAYEKRRDETTINEADLIDFDKQVVMKNAMRLSDKHNQLLYLLTTLIPTRRLDDYRTMKIGKWDGNYCEDGTMYIKDTNTKNKKSITIRIPNEMIELVPDEGYLLGFEYNQSDLSVLYSNVMEKVYGKKITANQVRRMYMTKINKAGASYVERKGIAEELGQSVVEGIRYSMKTTPQQAQS